MGGSWKLSPVCCCQVVENGSLLSQPLYFQANDASLPFTLLQAAKLSPTLVNEGPWRLWKSWLATMCVGKAQSSPMQCSLRCALSSGKLDTHISKNEWGWEIRNTVMRPLSDLDCLLGWRSLRRLMQTWSLVLGRVSALIIGWSEKQANKMIFLSLKNASIIFKCKDYSWIQNQKGRSDEIMLFLLPPHLEWNFFLNTCFENLCLQRKICSIENTVRSTLKTPC